MYDNWVLFHPILIKLCFHYSYNLFKLFGTIIKFIKTLGKLFAIGGGDVYMESNLWYLGWLF